MYCQQLSCDQLSPCALHADTSPVDILKAETFPEELSKLLAVKKFCFIATLPADQFEAAKAEYLGPEPIPAYPHGNGVIVGVTFGEMSVEGCGYLTVLVLAPHFRRGGLGRMLASFAIRQVQEWGGNIMHLRTMDFQGPLYYGRLGFNLDYIRSVSGAWVQERAYHSFSADIPATGLLPGLPEPQSEIKINGADVTIQPSTDERRDFVSATFAAHTKASIGRAHPDLPRFAVYHALDRQTGEVIGAIDVSYLWDVLWIKELVVSESHRRQGVGKALVQAGLLRGECLGAGLAAVVTTEVNSREFFLHLGWEIEFEKGPITWLILHL